MTGRGHHSRRTLRRRHDGEQLSGVEDRGTWRRRLFPALRVKIVDETGRPASARIYLTGADGLVYAPRGHISRITAISAEYYFHARDGFEVSMPAGQARIEAT